MEYRYEQKYENILISESTEQTPSTPDPTEQIQEHLSVETIANGDKVVMTGLAVELFMVERFCGNEKEDIEDFFDTVLVFFCLNKIHHDDILK